MRVLGSRRTKPDQLRTKHQQHRQEGHRYPIEEVLGPGVGASPDRQPASERREDVDQDKLGDVVVSFGAGVKNLDRIGGVSHKIAELSELPVLLVP